MIGDHLELGARSVQLCLVARILLLIALTGRRGLSARLFHFGYLIAIMIVEDALFLSRLNHLLEILHLDNYRVSSLEQVLPHFRHLGHEAVMLRQLKIHRLQFVLIVGPAIN